MELPHNSNIADYVVLTDNEAEDPQNQLYPILNLL